MSGRLPPSGGKPSAEEDDEAQTVLMAGAEAQWMIDDLQQRYARSVENELTPLPLSREEQPTSPEEDEYQLVEELVEIEELEEPTSNDTMQGPEERTIGPTGVTAMGLALWMVFGTAVGMAIGLVGMWVLSLL